MAKQNVINRSSQSLTLDPGAAGDSFLQFSINTTGEFRIGVDDTDDSFRISQGSALGTNDTFVMSAVGENLKPLQPAFAARNTSSITNVTGDGTVYTIVYGTEIFDNVGNFVTTTFTAPRTGRYRLVGSMRLSPFDATYTSGYTQIVTTSRTYRSWSLNYGAAREGISNQLNIGIVSVLCDMDATDTAVVQVMVSGGLKTLASGGGGRGLFNGVLVC